MGASDRWTSLLLLLPLTGFLLGLGEDPPKPAPFDPAAARKLAEERLDGARGEKGRELYRIVWPEGEPHRPEPGAEVVLIGGDISNYLVVMRWTGEAVQVARLSATHGWDSRTSDGPSAAATVLLAPDDFATRWAAARLIAGATVQRKGPPPAPPKCGPWAMADGTTHIAENWARLRTVGAAAPLFLANRKGTTFDGDGVRTFEEVSSQLVYSLFHEAYGNSTRRWAGTFSEERPTLDFWRAFLRAELRQSLSDGAILASRPKLLLLEVCLRALSTAGDESDLALVRKVDALLAEGDREDFGIRSCREEAGYAIIRLRLRWEWDPAFATSTIRGNPRHRHARSELSRWTRKRFADMDRKGYREMLLEDLRTGRRDRELLLETIPEVASRMPAEARALLEPLQKGIDDDVAVAVRETMRRLPPLK